MPLADKIAVNRIISTQFSDPTESALKNLGLRVHNYARDTYTPFKSLLEERGSPNSKKFSKVQEKVRHILASWRGCNQWMESRLREHSVRTTHASTFGDA